MYAELNCQKKDSVNTAIKINHIEQSIVKNVKDVSESMTTTVSGLEDV